MKKYLKPLILTSVALATIVVFGLFFFKNSFFIKAFGLTAKFELPQTVNAHVGDLFSVPIGLNTGGSSIRGVDVSLHFNKAQFELINVVPTAINSTNFDTYAPVTNVLAFDNATVVSQANATGTVKFSAFTYKEVNSQGEVLDGFSGSTALAILQFKALANGNSPMTIEYVPNSSYDSNVINEALPPEDVLGEATTTQISISDAVLPTPTMIASTATSAPLATATITPTIPPIVSSPIPTQIPTAAPTTIQVTPLPTITPGPAGNMEIRFDGVNDIVRGSQLTSIDQNFTVEFLFKIASRQATRSDTKILFANTNDVVGWSIEFKKKSVEFWYVDTQGTWKMIRYPVTVSPDKWHHLAVVYNNENIRVFVDGKLRNTQKNVGKLSQSPGLYIGGLPGNSYYYKGSIDEIRISSDALYLNDFNPPFSKLTASSNTLGLYHIDSHYGRFIFDSSTYQRSLFLGLIAENTNPQILNSDSPAK